MSEEKELSEEQAALLEKQHGQKIRRLRAAAGMPSKSIYECREEVMRMTLPQIQKAEPLYLARAKFLALKIINEHGMSTGKKNYDAINVALNFLRLCAGKPHRTVTDGQKPQVVSKKIKPERYVFGDEGKTKPKRYEFGNSGKK